MMENVSPILDGSNVIIHTLASLYSIWKHPNNLTNVLNACDEFQVFEIIESNFNLMNKTVSSLEAVLDFNEMVVTSKPIDKTGSKVWHSIYRRKMWSWKIMETFDWSQKINKGCSSVITSIEPVSRSPVLLFFMNSLLHFCTMENPSSVNSFNQSEWMMENISPFLNSSDITLDPFAMLYSVWKHPNDLSNVFYSINKVEVLEII